MEIELTTNTILYAIGGLLLAGGSAFLLPASAKAFGTWLNEEGEVPVVTHDSAICEHVAMVIETAYAAPPDVLLEYLKKGFSRIEVLQAEVDRLAPKKDAA